MTTDNPILARIEELTRDRQQAYTNLYVTDSVMPFGKQQLVDYIRYLDEELERAYAARRQQLAGPPSALKPERKIQPRKWEHTGKYAGHGHKKS